MKSTTRKVNLFQQIKLLLILGKKAVSIEETAFANVSDYYNYRNVQLKTAIHTISRQVVSGLAAFPKNPTNKPDKHRLNKKSR